MNTRIEPKDRAFYLENGYFARPDFLSPEELEAWRAAVGNSVSARQGNGLPGTDRYDTKNKGEYGRDTFLQLINLWKDNPAIGRLILSEALGRMLCELSGLEGIRLWHDQALIKPPWGNPTAYHRDNPYWSFHDARALSIWVALDAATRDNGCLYYIPGSHRSGDFRNSGIGPRLGDIYGVLPEFAGVEPVAAPLPAGGCVIHNGLTIHGAGANMTPRPRRAMTGQFMPLRAVYNGIQNVLSDEEAASLKVGDPLEDRQRNPLLFQAG
ncbi:MAG: phytanoyl-CoA dioxygenase family protein [Spirochaetes bacterium]|nr:phytanoyl-CoA dioxygenase family protein [Spirochaetota bacterium]